MPLRFVIHLHRGHGPDHYDLMLAAGGASLATWRLSASPVGLAGGQCMPAVRLADHRAAYLDYEGPVSRGRGRVDRFDAGTYGLIARTPDRWEVELRGERVRGRFVLRRDAAEGQAWTLSRAADRSA
jgi:hypothetical protein